MSEGWSISHPKARKAHVCEMCGRHIDPGETYLRGAGFDDGTAWSWKECGHCETVRRRYDLEWDGVYNSDTFLEWATELSGDLAELRLKGGYQHKWRTALGALWPLPPDRREANEPGGGTIAP